MLSECRVNELLDYATDYDEFDENTPVGTLSTYDNPMTEERRIAIVIYKKVLGKLPVDYRFQPVSGQEQAEAKAERDLPKGFFDDAQRMEPRK